MALSHTKLGSMDFISLGKENLPNSLKQKSETKCLLKR